MQDPKPDLNSIRKKLNPYLPDILKAKGKDIVLFLGITGSGKSTAISALLGQDLIYNRKKLVPNHDAFNDGVIYPTIARSTIESETTCSAAYFPEGIDFAYCDTAGFLDTDEVEGRIIASISLELAIRLSSQIKSVVVVINQHDLDSQKGATFKALSELFGKLFEGNYKEYAQSIGFLISRVSPNDLAADGAENIKQDYLEDFKEIILEKESKYKKLLALTKSSAMDMVKGIFSNREEEIQKAEKDLLVKSFLEMMLDPSRLIVMDYKRGDTFQGKLHEFIANSSPIPKDAFSFSSYDSSRISFDQMIYSAISLHHKPFAFIESYPKDIELCDKKIANHQSEINRKNERLSALKDGDESLEVEKNKTLEELEIKEILLQREENLLDELFYHKEAYEQDITFRKSDEEVVYSTLKFEDFKVQEKPDQGKHKTLTYHYEQETPILKIKGSNRVSDSFKKIVDPEEGLSCFDLKYHSKNMLDWWFSSTSFSNREHIDDYFKGLVLQEKEMPSNITNYLLFGVGKEIFEVPFQNETLDFLGAINIFNRQLSRFINKKTNYQKYINRLSALARWINQSGDENNTYFLDSINRIAEALLIKDCFVLLITKIQFLPENVKWVNTLEEKIEETTQSIRAQETDLDRIKGQIAFLKEKMEKLDQGIQEGHQKKIEQIQQDIQSLNRAATELEGEKLSLEGKFKQNKNYIESNRDEILFVYEMLQSLSYNNEHPLMKGFIDYCNNYFSSPGYQDNDSAKDIEQVGIPSNIQTISIVENEIEELDPELLHKRMLGVSGQDFLKVFENTIRLKDKDNIDEQSVEEKVLENDLKSISTILHYRKTFFEEIYPNSPKSSTYMLSNSQKKIMNDVNIRNSELSVQNKALEEENDSLRKEVKGLEEENMQLKERLVKFINYIGNVANVDLDKFEEKPTFNS